MTKMDADEYCSALPPCVEEEDGGTKEYNWAHVVDDECGDVVSSWRRDWTGWSKR